MCNYRSIAAKVSITHFSDPGCPFAYSAAPALAVLRWRYGAQLAWRLVTIGLSEDASRYEELGYTPTRMALGNLRFRRHGMPFAFEPRSRSTATARACRTIVAARLNEPGREHDVHRALQLAWFNSTLLLDEDADIAQALTRVPDLDAEKVLAAGGFQTIEAYDVLIANLDPTLQREAPAEDALEVLERFPAGLASQEVAAVMAQNNQLPDRAAAEHALIELVGAGKVRRTPLGDDALWQPVRKPHRTRRVASSAEMTVTVTLPDGNELELADGATGADAAASIGPGLARAALAVEVSHPEAGEGPQARDLSRPLPDGARLSILTKKSGASALELIRHDTAHVLAEAVLELYPGVKISIGPPIENGFYYDFEFPDGVSISEADFAKIEERMRAHVKAGEPFERRDVSPGEARERFAGEGQDYKVELIDDLVEAGKAAHPPRPLETVSLYTNGPFTDLCRGPHAPSTKSVGAFKLQSVAGAYWRGDSERTMLTRIYGTAFFTKEELAEHLERIELAKERDHRKLGRELGLFTFSEVSPGAAFWLPAGTTVFNTLVGVSREMGRERGYSEVKTPQIYDAELWKTSGHWGKYRKNMFTLEVEEREMGVKPMNCPGHAHLFGSQRHSYRDLPVRYSEPGLLHRNEASGVLHGLLRVRHFAQDDAHIFCTEEQVQQEVRGCLEMAFATYELFGLDVKLELSTRPDERIGNDEMWDRAEAKLASALDELGLEYELNPGDGAFYGPKIDMHMTDSLGRSWQLGTVQLDYSMPERFGLTYNGADNQEHTPVMIHRAAFGSYERFIGIMLEHYGGELPLWLTPVQAIVLPVSDRFNDYAAGVHKQLLGEGVRVELDARNESVGRKIREAELRKVPYMLIVGEREQGDGSVSVREHRGGDTGSMTVKKFSEQIEGELYSPALQAQISPERGA